MVCVFLCLSIAHSLKHFPLFLSHTPTFNLTYKLFHSIIYSTEIKVGRENENLQSMRRKEFRRLYYVYKMRCAAPRIQCAQHSQSKTSPLTAHSNNAAGKQLKHQCKSMDDYRFGCKCSERYRLHHFLDFIFSLSGKLRA